MGLLLQKEVEVLLGLRNDPKRPFVAVLGGAKISDKLGVVEALLDVVDSLVDRRGDVLHVPRRAGQADRRLAVRARPGRHVPPAPRRSSGKTIHLPEDIVGVDAGGNVRHVRAPTLPDGAKGFDIGPGTAAAFSDVIMDARTVFWNGPMGMFEDDRFAAGTRTVAQAMADTKAFTVVGGGDSRGGARRSSGSTTRSTTCPPAAARRLELLELGDLPGLAALRGGSERQAEPTRHEPLDLRQLEDEPQPLRGDPDRPEARTTSSAKDDLRRRRRQRPPAVHRHPHRADRDRGRRARASLLGAQHCHWEDKGAFTGEVVAGVPRQARRRSYVICGHSERRELFGETDEMVQPQGRRDPAARDDADHVRAARRSTSARRARPRRKVLGQVARRARRPHGRAGRRRW